MHKIFKNLKIIDERKMKRNMNSKREKSEGKSETLKKKKRNEQGKIYIEN